MCNKCKNECSCKNNTTFHHTMTMQVQDQFGAFIGEPFDIVLTVNVNGNQVTIQVPTINVVINSGFSGGVIATVNNFLSKCLWPETLVFLAFEQKYDQSAFPDTTELSLLVGNDGSIRIVSSINYLSLIQDGPLITLPTAVTYLVLREKCIMEAPQNVQVSTARSDVYESGYSGYFLEFYDVSIENDNVAVCWASNSLDFPTTAMDQSVSVGKVVYDGAGRPQLQMGPPVIAVKANDEDICVEQAIAINPTNPLNIVSVTLRRVRSSLIEKDFFQGWTSRSIDAGLTWTSQRTEDTVFTQQRGRGDWNLACDKFGNFWFFGMYQFSDGAGSWTDANRFNGIAVSSDGGQTFQEVGTMSPNDPDFMADYPRISFGGDGQGGYGAWLSVTFQNTDFTIAVVDVAFLPINGLGVGNIGPITQFKQNNLLFDSNNPSLKNTALQYPEILATPEGKVYVVSKGFDTEPLALLYISCNLNGTNGFSSDSFGPSKLIAQGNVITFGVTEANVVYNGTRTITNVGYRLGYDSNLGRIYTVYINEKPSQSQNVILTLIYSDDDGSSWKIMGEINDTNESERGTINMGRDSTTGNLFFSWFDARGDPTLRSINLFAAVLDPDNIRKKKTKRCCNDLKPIKVPVLPNSDVVTSSSVSRTRGKKFRMEIQ